MAEFIVKESIIKGIIDEGEREGLFKVSGKKVEYLAVKKSYNFFDPEEQVRASFYYELIKKYQYPKERIDLEIIVPRREPTDKADIVIYEDDGKKKPYIVVECKKDGISQAEIKQAIEQAFGNANSLRSKYSILVAGNVRIAFDVANFPPEEREKNIIADIPVRYGKVIKFKYRKGDPQWDLKDVTRDELLAKFQQCHDALWEGGKRNPAEAFDEMSKLMYCKIQDERFLTKRNEYYRFQVGTYETLNEVAERIKKIYKDAQEIDPEVFIESIKADNPIIYTVAEILQGISLARTDLDVKGEGYEHFLGGVFRGAMGQYFTPRPVVTFMVNFLEPNINDFVIDPACGSGGFLIYTLERMRKELYAKLDEKDAAYRWQDFALKQIYGIEINSQLARVSMMNMIIHEDGHTNIENADALDNPESWKRQKIREYFSKKFTLLLTNPPFGASIKEKEKPYLVKYELGGKTKRRNRQNTEILFIERCLDFLKPGGRMGIVLPDGILTNSSLQYVRDFITERAQILGVVSLPQTTFKRPSSKGSGDSGSGVKASLLFLRKKKEGEKLPENYPIFMAIAEHIGYDATGRPDKDEFPYILKAWEEFKKTNRMDFFVKAPLCFAVGRGKLDDAFNPLRFTCRVGEERKWSRIEELGDVIYQTYNPQKQAPEDEFALIRIDDLEKDPVEVSNIRYMKGSEIKGLVQLIEKGDILIARLGPCITNKKFVIAPHTGKQSVGSTEFIVFRPRGNLESYFTLGIFKTDFYSDLMLSRCRGGTPSRYRLSREDFLKLPFPRIISQQKLGEQLKHAFNIKKENEIKAKELLDSIEPYVLEKLGIKIPSMEDKSPIVFIITAKEFESGRLDPFHYTPKFTLIGKALSKCKYPLREIGDILSGYVVNGLDARNFVETGTKYLRVSNIKADEIDETDIKHLDISLGSIKKDIKLKSNDILLTRKGTFGISVVVEGSEDYIISSEVMRLRLREEINPFYFSIINNTLIIQEQYKQNAVGAIMGSLSQEVLKTVKIPVPPLSIQRKIVGEVQNRREKAKRLGEYSKELLEKVKTQIEELILRAD